MHSGFKAWDMNQRKLDHIQMWARLVVKHPGTGEPSIGVRDILMFSMLKSPPPPPPPPPPPSPGVVSYRDHGKNRHGTKLVYGQRHSFKFVITPIMRRTWTSIRCHHNPISVPQTARSWSFAESHAPRRRQMDGRMGCWKDTREWVSQHACRKAQWNECAGEGYTGTGQRAIGSNRQGHCAVVTWFV